MKKSAISAIATLLFSVGAIGYLPNASAAQGTAQEQEQSGAMTIRGCLTKDAQSQQYVVLDDRSGEKVSFDGPAQLDRYVNQTVEITGRVVNRKGAKTFQPQAIKSVASSCKAPSAK